MTQNIYHIKRMDQNKSENKASTIKNTEMNNSS